MCTVTIIRASTPEDAFPSTSGLFASNEYIRIACNRDEGRSRPPALPPEIRTSESRRFIMPVDPVSNGTWIGVNDAGVFATLLNSYFGNAVVHLRFDDQGRPTSSRLRNPFEHRATRGDIVPKVMAASSLAEARRIALALPAITYPPFRLVVTDGIDVDEFRNDGTQITAPPTQNYAEMDARRNLPIFFTSSGLGDAVVESPRAQLLHSHFADPNPSIPKSTILNPKFIQDSFHAHQWPDRLHLSVCMERPDAKTVSYTVVELRDSEVAMTYYPEGPLKLSPSYRLALPRR